MARTTTRAPPPHDLGTFAPVLVTRPESRGTARILRRDDWPCPAPDDRAFDFDEWEAAEMDDEQH